MNRTCSHCQATFAIPPEDLAFLEKLAPIVAGRRFALPPPTHCPACRYQRRLAFRNERTLYHRTCDLSGRSMIAMHPADAPFPVYHITEWLSDRWDPASYGREFDFSRPFFEQFQELCNAVPHFSAFVDPHMDRNSEYTNCSSEAKDCYMISQAEKNEDCYYARGINTCRNCCDCFRVHRCELCYELVDGNGCYRCLWCQDCDNCSDCLFSTDLRGCSHCFGCHGLVQKEYYIFNESVEPEEWEAKVGKLILTHDVIAQMQSRSASERLRTPQRAVRLINCEDCTGDHLSNSRRARSCFDANDLEDCAYCNEIANGAKDCMDYCMWGIQCELLYEVSGCGYNVQRVLFSNHCWQNVSNLLYCESCFPAVRDCFGCFGLRNARYCILNRQYTKERYEELLPLILEHMRSTGEYGEFFPIDICAYGYNESLAQLFFPLEREQVKARGWPWRDEPQESEQYLGPLRRVPEEIGDVTDAICDQILRCEVTGKPYRIIRQELELYRTLGVPLPKRSPQQRHIERAARRNPRRLWQRPCASCGVTTPSTFSPERPEKVFCEVCYLKAVY